MDRQVTPAWVPSCTAQALKGAGRAIAGQMKYLIILLLLVLVYLQYRLWVGDGNVSDVIQLDNQVETQRAENIRLRERNDVLSAEVRDLQQGLDAIEEHAREDLGMVKDGETFYQIVE